MTGHIHAAVMAEYVQDAAETSQPWARWQYNSGDGVWSTLEQYHPWHVSFQYRRKPRTININGHEVPEPVRAPLDEGQRYFIVDLNKSDGHGWSRWDATDLDRLWLRRGMIHLTHEAAEAHAYALLSFTKVKR